MVYFSENPCYTISYKIVFYPCGTAVRQNTSQVHRETSKAPQVQ